MAEGGKTKSYPERECGVEELLGITMSIRGDEIERRIGRWLIIIAGLLWLLAWLTGALERGYW
jgi:hypothetical protein